MEMGYAIKPCDSQGSIQSCILAQIFKDSWQTQWNNLSLFFPSLLTSRPLLYCAFYFLSWPTKTNSNINVAGRGGISPMFWLRGGAAMAHSSAEVFSVAGEPSYRALSSCSPMPHSVSMAMKRWTSPVECVPTPQAFLWEMQPCMQKCVWAWSMNGAPGAATENSTVSLSMSYSRQEHAATAGDAAAAAWV